MATSGDRNSTVSPPAGLGSVPGFGEAFRMNLNTGQGVYSYKLALPDGVARYSPLLTLEYSHGLRLGPFGFGWRLQIRSIDRRLDHGAPEEGAHETWLDNDSEIIELQDGSFGALSEAAFSRYTRAGDGWRIEERDGSAHELGMSAAGRIEDPAHPGRVQSWLLQKSTDVNGNTIDYRWDTSDGIAYPLEILYAVYAVRFVYETRPDVRIDGKAGFLRRLAKRCTRIELFLNPGPNEKKLRAWVLTYDNTSVNGVSLLTAIGLTSYSTNAAQGPDVVRPPVRFSYNRFDPLDHAVRYFDAEAGDPPLLLDPDVALVNLDQAPLPGVLQTVEGRQYYWRNNGSGWDAPEFLGRTPYSGSFATAGVAFADMNGSGKPDLMLLAPGSVPGYFENDGQQGWGRFVAYPRAKRTMPAWTSNRLRLADNDGDGRIDAIESSRTGFVVWRNEGELGWGDPQLVPRVQGDNPPVVDFANPLVVFADMTGDGQSDLVEIHSGSVKYWPNLGNGQYGDGIIMQNSPRLRELERHAANLFLIDVDGDGCADLVYFGPDGLTVAINRNGSGFSQPVLLDTVPAPIPGSVRSVNLTGTATTGLAWNSQRSAGKIGYVHVEFSPSSAPYLLASVDNGSGLISDLFYRSAVQDYLADRQQGSIWSTNFPFPLLVVARTRETDQVTGQVMEILYQYHEAHYEPHGRRFEGFRTTERIEKGDDSRPDTRSVHHFLMAQEKLSGNGPEYAALNGLLGRVETYLQDGSPLQDRPYRVETCEHGLTVLNQSADGRKRSFVFVTRHRQEDTERTDDVRVEEKTYTYDALGNVVREVLRGSGTGAGVAQPTRMRTTEVTFAVSTHYLPAKPARVTVRDQDGVLLSEKRLYYDGPDFVGLPLGQADRGLATREEEWVLTQADFAAHYAGLDQAGLGYISDINADGTPSVFATTQRRRYDARGLVTAVRDALGNDTRFEFDDVGLFRTQTTDPLGDTRFEYEPATGQITRVTYADGGVTQFAYDAQGRLLRAALPGQTLDDAPTTYIYDEGQVPNRRTARLRQDDGSYSLGVTYFGGYGREFQQRVEVEPGKFLVSGLKWLNPWGDLRQEFEPTFADTSDFALPDTTNQASRRFFYDARGRIVKSVNYNGGVASADYQPFRVVTRDANDNDDSPINRSRGQFDTPHEEEFDVFRYLIRVTERVSATRQVVTEYEVGAMGELLTVSDGAGVKFRYRYDRRGNRLVITPRDAGERKIWYDARNKAVRTLDGADHDIRAAWDGSGRLTQLTSNGSVLEEYVYDTPAQQAFGRLAEAGYIGGRQVFTYDAAGRLMQRACYYDGLADPHILRYERDPLGREKAVIHSDGTRFDLHLTLNGWLKAIPNILKSVEYDPRGLATEIVYQNDVHASYEYTSGPGRVSRLTTVSPRNEVLAQVQFLFDKMEMLLSSNDTAPGGAGLRQYAYDPLYQLTGLSSTENNHLVVKSYDYTGDYNLQRFEEARSTLHYDDAAHPDRLAGLTPDGGSRFTVAYDGNGNLLSLPGQQFEYNAKNELTRFTKAEGLVADYRYDHLGLRVSKRVDDGHANVLNILYVGDEAEIRNGNPAYFVRAGSMRVAVLYQGTTLFVHENGLGSTSFFTDAAGRRTGSVDYYPFGNVAGSSGDLTFATFSLHPIDAESGLVYMRRRYYAPSLGRFLTPDLMALYRPERFLHAPQGLHLYAFVANDPLNKSDPTGLSFWSFVGAVVGVIVGVAAAIAIVAAVAATGGAAGVLLGIGLALGASLGVVGVSYLIASNVDPNSVGGQFMRGFMIGFNAGMNGVLAGALFGAPVGVALGVVGFLATFEGVAHNSVYQGILGWSSWLMPMSWGVTGLGLAFFAFNLFLAGVTFQQWNAAKIDKLGIDWKTGTIVMLGGLIRNGTGFNMGNFVFLDPKYVDGSSPDKTYDAVVAHETGHTLNTAAFGTAFEFADLISENLVGKGKQDYGEQLAESHANRKDGSGNPLPTIPMWG